ncbi:SusC/RagA family TonB-linked outer membrane protein [Belliella kenyensis]|uniref:SusC/RagA family TonB-linked outer membrane protein n=1 Tax=Belliella kenyensis TaxID=1472724 RepID=A0ABV8EJM3_9BACT|nr:TonB-dependent receptor [Belliella kenyensis]MCH7401295.1 TonB-dependent receptor [Belliella kenyensis]MDN3602740.1 TonB-dependent receptor [Belliella kenyensis]
MRKALLLLVTLFAISFQGEAWAQQRQITGTVLSAEDDLPLPGVNVRVKGTTRGAVTNIDGQYTIQASENETLVFSFVGFINQEVVAGNRSTINITLKEDSKILGEVVVVGYGSVEKKELTGSVGQLTASVIKDVPVLGVDQALQGRIAGVQITQNAGTPGAGISVRVRGSSSISASNQPLFVIDGVPMTTGDPSQLAFGGQSSNALADLNPSDIESMEVLKDAAAAAIYGSRAANGVVLITTKRGANQKTQVNLNVYGGTQQLWNEPTFLDRRGYLDLMKDAFAEDFFGVPSEEITDEDILDFYYGGLPYDESVNTNWVREVTRSAPIQNYELSISGGNDKTKYYLSGNYFDQQGTVINSRYSRMSTRFNLDHKVSDRIDISFNSGISRAVQNRIVSDNTLNGPFANSLAASPLWPVFEENGAYTRPQFFYSNPVAEGTENDDENQSIRIFTNALGKYKIIDGLNFNVRLGADILNFSERRYTPDNYPGSSSSAEGGSGSFSTYNPIKWVAEAFVDYAKVFEGGHSINLVAGHNREENIISSSIVRGIQFPGDRFRYLGAAALVNEGNNNLVGWGLESYFGRVNYNYKEKYLLSSSFRADASSRFGPNNRWGYFPSISAGWRINEETFMNDLSMFSDLKLRGSYGLTGNQEIGNFSWRGLVGTGNYLGAPSIVPVQLGNPDLKWENTAQTDIGLDVGLFNGRLTLVADYYYKKTTDLLFARPIATQSGYGSYQSNIGAVENKGWEFTVSTVNIDRPNGLNWRTDLNLTFNRNKILELYNGEDVFYGFGGNSIVLREGHPIGTFYGLISDGVFMTEADVPDSRRALGIRAGDMNYRDINEDGIITDDDFTIIGNAQPKFFGGFTNSFSYKGFDAQIFMQFSYGNDIWNAAGSFQEGMFANFFDDNNKASVERRWRSEENPGNGLMPRAAYDVSANRNNDSNTSRFIEDGSYLRVKNLVIGYRLPQATLDRIKLRSVRLYAQAQNLLTFTNYSGFDPEVNFAGTSNTTIGVDFYTFPQPRTYTFGVNIGF